MIQDELFPKGALEKAQEQFTEIFDTLSEFSGTCKTCEHRQRWDKGWNSVRIFQYCGVRTSNRTQNGLLKIKCKNKSCHLYKKIKVTQASCL